MFCFSKHPFDLFLIFQCKVVIDEIDRVFQMILNGVKPGKICVALGICKNGTSFTEDQFAILKTPIAGSLSNYFEKKTEIHKRMPAVLKKYPAIVSSV